MERIKNWFIKYKHKILFVFIFIFVWLHGLGTASCINKYSTACADYYAGNTATFDVPFGGLTFIPPSNNVGLERLTVPMPTFIGDEYGFAGSNEFYYSSSYIINDEYGQLDYYEYASNLDGFLYRDINVSSNPFGGFAGFSLVASDFVITRSLIEYHTDFPNYFEVIDIPNQVSLLYKPTLSGLVVSPYDNEPVLVVTEITEQDVYRNDLAYWSMLDAFYLDCLQAIGATTDVPILVSGFRMAIDLNTVLNGDSTFVHIGFGLPVRIIDYRSTGISNFNLYLGNIVGDADVDPLGMIVTSVNSILSIEIFPNVSFLTLLSIALAIPLVVWLLKAWLGG